MAKEKFLKKSRSGKAKLMPQEKRDNMSHIGKRNQQWKAQKMQEAIDLWAQNDNLPPNKQLSMRAIAKKASIAKTTVIERLSGRCKGSGHIAGGARKSRIMLKGTQVGHQEGHLNCFNHFNQTFTWVTKWVIKWVSCSVVCTTDALDNTTFMPSF